MKGTPVLPCVSVVVGITGSMYDYWTKSQYSSLSQQSFNCFWCFLCDYNRVLFFICLMAWGKTSLGAKERQAGSPRMLECIPVGQEPQLGGDRGQVSRQPLSPKPFWPKPTLRGSSVTFATFKSHGRLFWKRWRWDPFGKEEGRRDGEPNSTRENHFLRFQ